MANKSGVSEQVINVPQGGGAIKGIGETFTPDLYTGAGNFTVPIAVPSGRNGFQPQIDLIYSSGNGNGIFGFGWSLSIPNIQRKTSKGIPRYQDTSPDINNHDTFILSGAEDLVPVDVTAVGRIRYRPRTEGIFAHIDHHQTEIDDYWMVQTTDGLLSFFGTPSQIGADTSVLSNPDNPQQIFAWYLTRTEDTFGNQIVYEYDLDATGSGTQMYLKTVRYLNN